LFADVLAVAAVILAAAVLEADARMALNRQARRQQAARQDGPAPLKAHDMSALDRVHVSGPGICWLLRPNLENYEIKGRC